MATYRKRGATWRAEVCKAGTRTSKSFPTKQQAREWATATEQALAESDAHGVVPATLRDVLLRYKNTVAPKHKGYRWEAVRIDRFMREEPALVCRNIHTITTDELTLWKERRLAVVQAVSVRRDIALLSVVWKHAQRDWRNVRTNPWKDLIKPPGGRPRERIFSEEEVQSILKALSWSEEGPVACARQEVAAAFLLSLETAMRSKELVTLTWDQVHVAEKMIQLDDSKNGDRRAVPLSDRAIELLGKLRGNDQYRVFTISNALRDVYFRKAKDIAGVTGVTFHDSRATALTRLSKKLGVLELARMVGHRDPRSLMIYYRESATNIAAKLN